MGAASWLYSPRPYLWFSASLLIQSARFQVGSVARSGAAACELAARAAAVTTAARSDLLVYSLPLLSSRYRLCRERRWAGKQVPTIPLTRR